MSFTIEPLSENELTDFAHICQAAFVDGIGSVLLNGGAATTPENHAELVKDLRKNFLNDLSTRFLKAVDTSTGAIIAVAKWNFFLREQTQEELGRTLHQPQPGEEDYVPRDEPILAYILGSRREFMGTKPYIYLSILATNPEFHRRGAGGRLIEWGVRQADGLGLETYLESSKEGKPLYGRWGFEVVKEVPFDMMQFGRADLTGVDSSCIMIRKPAA